MSWSNAVRSPLCARLTNTFSSTGSGAKAMGGSLMARAVDIVAGTNQKPLTLRFVAQKNRSKHRGRHGCRSMARWTGPAWLWRSTELLLRGTPEARHTFRTDQPVEERMLGPTHREA